MGSGADPTRSPEVLVRLPLRRREVTVLAVPLVLCGTFVPWLAPIAAVFLCVGGPPVGGDGWSLGARHDGLELRLRRWFRRRTVVVPWAELLSVRLSLSTHGMLVRLWATRGSGDAVLDVVVGPAHFAAFRSVLALASAHAPGRRLWVDVQRGRWQEALVLVGAAALVAGFHVWLASHNVVFGQVPPVYWAPSILLMSLAVLATAMMWRASAPAPSEAA